MEHNFALNKHRKSNPPLHLHARIMKTVAVLFARTNSIYKTIPECDVWDINRDALRWPGGGPLVAHPPCRSWGRLRWAAKPRPGEKELAIRAVEMIRVWGGVLEHPAHSSLWKALSLPKPGAGCDRWGGYTIVVNQLWWGHSCEKATWLYVCGIPQSQVPPIPLAFSEAKKVVTSSLYRKGHPRWKPHCTKEEREATPPAFAKWLVELVSKVHL